MYLHLTKIILLREAIILTYCVFTFYSYPFLWIYMYFLLQFYAYHRSYTFLILTKLKYRTHKK